MSYAEIARLRGRIVELEYRIRKARSDIQSLQETKRCVARQQGDFEQAIIRENNCLNQVVARHHIKIAVGYAQAMSSELVGPCYQRGVAEDAFCQIGLELDREANRREEIISDSQNEIARHRNTISYLQSCINEARRMHL